jgi:nucleoside-diphosphate-sugar epimerase
MNVSVNQVAEILKEIMDRKELKNVHKDPRPAEGRHGWADISKAERILSFHPRIHVKEGLAKLVDWYTKSYNRLE